MFTKVFFQNIQKIVTLGLLLGALGLVFVPTTASAKPFNLGPGKCMECHKSEYGVWEKTKHATSYKKVHKSKAAKAIVKAVGGKRMKKTELCMSCHYTQTVKKAGAKPKLAAGISCESCHGPSSEWITIHNNYGKGKTVKTEDAAHKAERIKSATAAGMIWPSALYDIAANCNSCHGFSKQVLTGENISAMMDAKHPINPDFEIVEYSQGTVRHRFYPPNVTENQEMSITDMSRMFVIGQAATLVSATENIAKSDHAVYKAAQEKRIATAPAVLKSVQSLVPEVGAFLATPTTENGRAFAAAIAEIDLSSAVSGRLPTKYK